MDRPEFFDELVHVVMFPTDDPIPPHFARLTGAIDTAMESLYTSEQMNNDRLPYTALEPASGENLKV